MVVVVIIMMLVAMGDHPACLFFIVIMVIMDSWAVATDGIDGDCDAEGWGCPSARASRTVLDGRGRHAPNLLLREGSLPDGRDYMLGDPVVFRGSRARPLERRGTP
jgi:hypothetical protein